MTFTRLDAMERYWRTNPPMHQLIRAYVGYKPEADREMNEGTLDEFMAAINSVNGNG